MLYAVIIANISIEAKELCTHPFISPRAKKTEHTSMLPGDHRYLVLRSVREEREEQQADFLPAGCKGIEPLWEPLAGPVKVHLPCDQTRAVPGLCPRDPLACDLSFSVRGSAGRSLCACSQQHCVSQQKRSNTKSAISKVGKG